MTNRNAKKPTGPTAEQLADMLRTLSSNMHDVASFMRLCNMDGFAKLTHAVELDSAAEVVDGWSREVAKEGKK